MALSVSGGGIEFDAIINGSQFQAQISAIERQLQGLTTTAEREAASIEKVVKNATGALAAYASFTSASSFVADVVRVRGEFQKISAVLSNALGSNSEAEASLKMISEYAATTPFQLNELSAAYVKLVNQGIKPTKSELTALGDLAASTGKGFDQLAEAIIDAQTGEFERLKEFGIRASKEGDKVMFTFKGVQTQVDFTSESIANYITGLGRLQGVAGSTAAISKTLEGQMSNLADAWDRMLNDIGQSGDGVFSGAIGSATSLIDNYQKVLDILGLMVATYGAYKAAVIATTAVEVIATGVKKGWTIAEILHFNAMKASEMAMKLLNRTMLANPAVAVATGIAALVATLVIFRDKAVEVKSAQDLLADSQERMAEGISETRAKIEPYVEALKGANVSEQQRVDIYEKLKEIDPKIVEGLNAKTISYANLKTNVDKYLDSLRNQYKLEANKSAIQASIKQEEDIQKQINKKQNELDKLNESIKKRNSSYDPVGGGGTTASTLRAQRIQFEIDQLRGLKSEQEKVTSFFGRQVVPAAAAGGPTDPNAGKTNKQIIDEKESLTDLATFRKKLEEQYQKESDAAKRAALADDLKYADARKKLLDVYGGAKESAKALQKEEKGINTLLEQRKTILEQIEALKRDSTQSGMPKEQSEVDKIAEKYEKAFKNIEEYNKKVAEFNRKNGTSTAGIGAGDINALKDARDAEISNTRSKQEAERYIKNLDTQRTAFEQYENAKKDIGVDAANEMYAEQRQGFTDYITFLKAQADDIAPRIRLGVDNVGDKIKFDAINKEIAEAEKKQRESDYNQKLSDYRRLFTETQSFNQKREALEDRFQKDAALIRAKYSGKELIDRTNALRAKYDNEEEELRNSLLRQSDLYKKLEEDISNLGGKAIRERITEMKKTLSEGFVEVTGADGVTQKVKLTDDAIQSLGDGIEKAEDSLDRFFGASKKKLQETAAAARDIGLIFSTISEALADTNPELSEMASQISELANTVSSALTAIASGDYVGAIASVIGSAVKTLSDAKRSATEAKKAVQEFYQAIAEGEIASAIATRGRLVEQAKANQLTLDGINAQKKQLAENKKAQAEQYNMVLKQIAQEQYIAGQTTKKGKGSLLFGAVGYFTGLGAKTKVENEMGSLAGMNFEQLEKLFNNGQLEGRAAELFNQLAKLKAEGVDIDKQLEELQQQAKEVFTGTTADGILDSIADGFANGLHTAADFASSFEDMMRKALINSLKYRFLEEPINELFDQFAAAAESGQGLTQTEIGDLQNKYNGIISNADKQFEQLQQIAGINFSSPESGARANSLAGAIKGITEQQAELLAGQFGGFRMSNLEILQIAKQNLDVAIRTENNTAMTVSRLDALLRKFDNYENGTKKISIN